MLIEAENGNPDIPRARAPNIQPAAQFVPLYMDINFASHYCGVGRTIIYNAIRDGELILRKHGGKSLFLTAELEAWMHETTKPSMPIPKGGNPRAKAEREAKAAAGQSEAA